MSEQEPEAVPGEDLVIRVPPATAQAGTDTGVKPQDEETGDGVD